MVISRFSLLTSFKRDSHLLFYIFGCELSQWWIHFVHRYKGRHTDSRAEHGLQIWLARIPLSNKSDISCLKNQLGTFPVHNKLHTTQLRPS